MSLSALTFFSPSGAGQGQTWAVGEVFQSYSPVALILLSSVTLRLPRSCSARERCSKAARDFPEDLSQGCLHLKHKFSGSLTPKDRNTRCSHFQQVSTLGWKGRCLQEPCLLSRSLRSQNWGSACHMYSRLPPLRKSPSTYIFFICCACA